LKSLADDHVGRIVERPQGCHDCRRGLVAAFDCHHETQSIEPRLEIMVLEERRAHDSTSSEPSVQKVNEGLGGLNRNR
jgi:hypothetical protein